MSFKIKKRVYPFGERKYAEPATQEFYVDSQRKRSHKANIKLEEVIKKIDKEELTIDDELRIKELTESKVFSEKNLSLGYCDVGFRNPKLMKFYKDKFEFVKGIDIVPENIEASKALGYNVELVDMSEKEFYTDLSRVGLITCYQVLEHVNCPLEVLKRFYELCDVDCLLHFETPIEDGNPRIQFGHLHEFQKNDLSKISELAGFTIISLSRERKSGFPPVERILLKKSN